MILMMGVNRTVDTSPGILKIYKNRQITRESFKYFSKGNLTLTVKKNTLYTRSYYRKETAASAFHIAQHDNTARAHLNQ